MTKDALGSFMISLEVLCWVVCVLVCIRRSYGAQQGMKSTLLLLQHLCQEQVLILQGTKKRRGQSACATGTALHHATAVLAALCFCALTDSPTANILQGYSHDDYCYQKPLGLPPGAEGCGNG